MTRNEVIAFIRKHGADNSVFSEEDKQEMINSLLESPSPLLSRDNIMEAIRKDANYEDGYALYNTISTDDKQELIIYFSPNDAIEQILNRMWETWDALDNEGLEDIMHIWDLWAQKRGIK